MFVFGYCKVLKPNSVIVKNLHSYAFLFMTKAAVQTKRKLQLSNMNVIGLIQIECIHSKVNISKHLFIKVTDHLNCVYYRFEIDVLFFFVYT